MSEKLPKIISQKFDMKDMADVMFGSATQLASGELKLPAVVTENLDTGECSVTFPSMPNKSFVLENIALKLQGRTEFRKDEIAPVDRSAIQLASGEPVTDDHRDINPVTGLQKAYMVLTPDERAKGFARPYRDAYRHLTCGKITNMGRAIAETYARDPFFYSDTFCSTCRAHFPIGEDGEFTWCEMDGREGPKVGT